MSRKDRLELRTHTPLDAQLLYSWRFATLEQSNTILVLGAKNNAPWALHQYRLEGGKLQKIRHIKLPCAHEYDIRMLGVVIKGQELLSVVCSECGDIKLLNLETGETHVAYRSEKVPHRLCLGEADCLWIWCWKDFTFREITCNSETFSETGRFFTRTPRGLCSCMCFLPAPHRILAFKYRDWLEAVSCETGQQLWKLDGKVDDKKIDPHDIFFHPAHHVLLVPENERILVLNPQTGHIQQVLPASYPHSFCWLGDRLLLLHGYYQREVSVVQLIDQGKTHICISDALYKKGIVHVTDY